MAVAGGYKGSSLVLEALESPGVLTSENKHKGSTEVRDPVFD